MSDDLTLYKALQDAERRWSAGLPAGRAATAAADAHGVDRGALVEVWLNKSTEVSHARRVRASEGADE